VFFRVALIVVPEDFGMRMRTKFFALSCSLFYCILSLLACSFDVPDIKNDEPIKEYFEHWTSTCQVGKIEYASDHVSMNGMQNLSAANPIEINLYTINPKQLRLLCKEGQNGFYLQTEDGAVVSNDNYSECMVDPTHVKIQARLDDAHEGKTWTLSGCLWPENRTDFSLEDLRGQAPELFYSASFVQNTPPDNVKDLMVVREPLDGKNAYLYFKLPDTQNLNRNTGSTYEVNYYLREHDGQLYWKGRSELTLADNKNSAGGREFFYCFPGQESSLTAYEYTVQVNGPHGRKSEFLSTDPSLGVCVLVEPTITVLDAPNGKFDEDNAEYECYELASNDGTVSFTASPGQEGDSLTVMVDNIPVTATGGVYTVSGIGRHVITVTSSRVGARSVTVAKKITLVKTPDAAVFEFDKEFNDCDEDANGYKFIEVESDDALVGYTITASEAGTRLSVSIDGGSESGEMTVPATGSLPVNQHTLVATVHKKNCNDVTSSKKVWILKSLEEPTFTTSNGNMTGSAAHDGETYDNYEYSYLKYSNLKYTVSNPVSNVDSTLTVTVDGSTVSSPTDATLSNGYHTIVMRVEKENLTPVEITKYVYVKIKRVCVTVGNISAFNSDGDKHVDLKGTFYAKTTRTSQLVLKAYTEAEGTKVKNNHTITPNSHVLYMDSPSDTFYFYTSKIEDYDGGSDNDDLGTVSVGKSDSTRTLSALKSSKHFHSYSSNTSRGHYEFDVTLSEVALPSITFSPDLNGCSDGSSNYEYIEVANASDKVTYTITSQESGATLSGKVDGTSFSGNKNGQLGIGDHTIEVTVSKTGLVGATVTRKIKVVQELKEPSIKFYFDGSQASSSGTPDDTRYLLYDAYDVALAADGSGSLAYIATPNSANSGASVVVVENYVASGASPVDLAASGELALGPHKLTFRVSKPGWREKEFTTQKFVFVQGILAPAKIQYSAKKTESNKVWTEMADTSSTQNLMFSYISYDKMPVKVAPGNTGNKIEVSLKKGDSVIASCGKTTDDFDNDDLIGHGTSVYTITVNQSRDYCKSSETATRNFTAKIKPVTLSMQATSSGELSAWITGLGKNSGETMWIRGTIKINGSNIFSWTGNPYKDAVAGTWTTLRDTDFSFSGTFSSPSDTITLTIADKFRRDKDGDDLHIIDGSETISRSTTLEYVRTGKNNGSESDAGINWTFICNTISNRDGTIRPRVTFTPSD